MVKLCGLQLDLSSVSRSIPTAFHPWHSAVTLAPSPLSTMMAWTCLTHHDCIQASVCPSELLLQCAPLPAGTNITWIWQEDMNPQRVLLGSACYHTGPKNYQHISTPTITKHVWSKLHPRSQVIYEVRSNLLSEATFAKLVSNASFCCFSFIPHGFRSRFLWATCRFDVLHGFVQFWDVHDSSETTYELMTQQFKGTHLNFSIDIHKRVFNVFFGMLYSQLFFPTVGGLRLAIVRPINILFLTRGVQELRFLLLYSHVTRSATDMPRHCYI